jgi:hypothetical protein
VHRHCLKDYLSDFNFVVAKGFGLLFRVFLSNAGFPRQAGTGLPSAELSYKPLRKSIPMIDHANPGEPDPAARREPLETNQPDPMLQMSTGRMGSGGMSLVAIAIVVILAVVFYGLNGRMHGTAPAQQPAAMANSGAPHG